MIKEYGYEYDAVLNEELYLKTKGKVTHNNFMGALCLRTGRDALKVVAREFTKSIVLIPALACDSMITPFKKYNHVIKYYKLNSDYSIDVGYLSSLIPDKVSPILFLYMDYFGNKALNDSQLNELKINFPNLVFIEDRTHNLFVENRNQFKADFTIASLRKWVNIPDGGLLWTDRKLMNKEFSEDLSFFESRLKAQCLRNEFFKTGNELTKKTYRKVFSTITDSVDEDLLPGLMSQYSRELLKQVDFNLINETRKKNASILISELNGFDFVQKKVGLGDVYVAVLVENRDKIQSELASKGIFCTIIWPLSDEQKEICRIAKYTEEHILTIYCDQRYTSEDMKYVAKCIRRICNE